MTTSNPEVAQYAKGAIGAAVGGAIGYFAFRFLAQQGFYGVMLPGALLGIGCGTASRIKSIALGVACAIAGFILGVFAEWSVFPAKADGSFLFFVEHLLELQRLKLIMITLGGIFAFWFGMGRQRFVRRTDD